MDAPWLLQALMGTGLCLVEAWALLKGACSFTAFLLPVKLWDRFAVRAPLVERYLLSPACADGCCSDNAFF